MTTNFDYAKIFFVVAEIQHLNRLLSRDGGNERWDTLQAWLRKNKKWGAYVKRCMRLAPCDALNYICQKEVGLKVDQMALLIPMNLQPRLEQLRMETERSIGIIQTLYRQRKAMDKPQRTRATKAKQAMRGKRNV